MDASAPFRSNDFGLGSAFLTCTEQLSWASLSWEIVCYLI